MLIKNMQEDIQEISIDNDNQEQKLTEQENVQEIKIQNHSKKYLIFKILNIVLYLLMIMNGILNYIKNYINPIIEDNKKIQDKNKQKTLLAIIKEVFKENVWGMVIVLIMLIIFYIISTTIISSDVFNILNTDFNNYPIIFNTPIIYYVGLIIIIISLIITILFFLDQIMQLFVTSFNIISAAITTTISLIQIIIIIYFLATLFYKKNWQYLYNNYGFWRIILLCINIIIFYSFCCEVFLNNDWFFYGKNN